MKTSEWFFLAALGGVGYFVYEALNKAGSTANKAKDAVASAVANPIVAALNWYYGSADVIPTGNVILPNGSKIPLKQLAVSFDDTNNVGSFVYQGYGYIIAPNPNGGPAYDQNGDYHAQ